MKQLLKSKREIIRLIAIVPLVAIVPVLPFNLIFFSIQATAFATMFWIGWRADS